MQKNEQRRTRGHPLVVLGIAAVLGGYAVGWLSTAVLEQPAAAAASTAGGISAPISTSASSEPTEESVEKAMVVFGDGAALREAAEPEAPVVARLIAGTEVTVLAGPIIHDGFAWYQLDIAGTTGWTAGASLSPSRGDAGMLDQHESPEERG